jgi:hypothetical protein
MLTFIIFALLGLLAFAIPEVGEADPASDPGQTTAMVTTAATGEPAAEKTFPETYVKQLRSEAQQRRQEADTLKARVEELENASKTELERLQTKAAKLDQVEPELKTLQATVTALVADLKAALPTELQELLPEGTPAAQLEWLRKAQKTAETLSKGDGKGEGDGAADPKLPGSGNRNPGAAGEGGAKAAQEGILKDLQRFVPALNGRTLRP